MSQSVAYVAEWACENNPTVGMSDKAMMAHYKANALAGDIRFYLSTQAASLTADEYHALAALAMISAVIPGTVWSELAPDRSALLMHVFDLEDEAAFIQHFKTDYEQPLKEIFE